MKKFFIKIKKRYLLFRYCDNKCANCKYSYDDVDYSCCELRR